MSGVSDLTHGTPVTQGGMYYLGQGGTSPSVAQAPLLAAVRTTPVHEIRVSQTPIMAAYIPRVAKTVKLNQTALLGLVSGANDLSVDVTQGALLIGFKSGIPTQTRNRSWTFDFDGHTFYVLDLGPEGTWVYDQVTQQWCKFETPGFGQWNMINGFDWESGRKIIGGDAIYSKIYYMDPTSHLDDGFRSVIYTVTGGLPSRSRTGKSVDSVRLAASVGNLTDPTQPMPTISLRFSDNYGGTWSQEYPFALQAGNYDQRVEWNSLGQMKIPGRVFEFTTTGGLVHIDGADAQIDGQE